MSDRIVLALEAVILHCIARYAYIRTSGRFPTTALNPPCTAAESGVDLSMSEQKKPRATPIIILVQSHIVLVQSAQLSDLEASPFGKID